MMASWTLVMGFPLISVEDAQWTEGQGWDLKLSQSWFVADGSTSILLLLSAGVPIP